MSDYQIQVLSTGVVSVRVDGKDAVSIGFITSGAPIALKRDPLGKLGPAIEAAHYVTMAGGVPVLVQTREDVVRELDLALGQVGSVSWQRK